MKIINAGFGMEDRDEKRGNLSTIESAGRTCYRSEDKISDGSADKFVDGLIKRKHEAVLEHGDYIFRVQPMTYECVARELQMVRNMGYPAPMLNMTALNNRPIISGNIRAWREFVNVGSMGVIFARHMDRIYTTDLRNADSRTPDNDGIEQIHYSDLQDVCEKEMHQRATVRWVIDRGVSHEFVRHRKFSFAMESTRYCNYSNDQFGGEINVIRPCYLTEGSKEYKAWQWACASAEMAYFMMLDYDLLPEEARAVLPTSTATQLVMTGTLGEWKHFFNLRALSRAGKPHPQAKEVAMMAYDVFAGCWPEIFG